MPAGFYDTPALRKALATYDFGPVFRAVRTQAALTQDELGFLVGLHQPRISAVEKGRHQIRDVEVVARVCAALGIPASLLGFGTPIGGSVSGEEVSWMDRRDFFQAVAAITLGVGAYPELERLEALLPVRSDPGPPRRVGAADVEAIEETTAAFRLFDFRHGGGLSRAAAVAQLDYVLKLRDADCSDEVRSRLLLATADLAKLAGWMTYDVEEHAAARQLWMVALETARRADHPHSADLTVLVHLSMAHQALHLDRPQEALRLARLGAATAATHTDLVSAGARRELLTNLATYEAALGNTGPCRRALGEAEQLAGDIDPTTTPPWASYNTIPAAIAAKRGYVYHLLGKSVPSYAPAAVEQLTFAVDGFGPAYARSRALDLPHLARSYFSLGEVEPAVATGHEAVTAISTLSSKRVRTRLRVLAEAAEPFTHDSSVIELRQRIRQTLVPASHGRA